MKYSNVLPQLIARLALGIGFILPVMDRFGILGGPGTKGIYWGEWSKFIDYTNYILPILNRDLSNAMGIFVTVCEILFGIGLTVGIKTRYMAMGSAALTVSFGVCMAVFLGIQAPFSYPVFVFTGAALLLSQADKFEWSIDQFMEKSKKNEKLIKL